MQLESIQPQLQVLTPIRNVSVDRTFHNFLDTLPDGGYLKDLSGKIIHTNSQLETTQFAPVYTALGCSTIREAEKTVFALGQTIAGTELTFSDDASTFYFLLDCMPWKDAQGQLQGVIGIVRDVTAERQSALESAEATNLLQSVLEHLPVRVFWKDTELTYLGCNTVFANDMGFEHPAQLIGHDDYRTNMTHEEADLCRGDDFHVLNTRQGRYGAEEVIGTGEGQTYIRVSKVPLHNASGDMIGVLGMYEDITEEKRAQIELENALRKERELNELKTRFISTVSHEYRNPLAMIQTSAEMLARHGQRMNDAMRTRRLESIRHAVKRMTLIMEDVLFIGREELQDNPPEYEAVNMIHLCEQVINLLGSDRVRVTLSGEQHPIIGVPLYLSHMVQNLLANALKYSEDEVELSLMWETDEFKLSVFDRGIGIPEESQEHIFDSFYRSSNVGTVEGTGLGLYIVKRAVEVHKGAISFTSQIDTGTQFSVALPNRPFVESTNHAN